MTRKPPDTEFRNAFRSLLQTYYSGTLKALAPDLGVQESTVSRWKNQKCTPNEHDREKVFNLLRDQEEKSRKIWMRRVHYVFAQAKPDMLEAILGVLNGKDVDGIDPVLLDRLAQLIILSIEVIK